ncbi:hypothetical protein LguiB_011015 [Lonicera macranthoides]
MDMYGLSAPDMFRIDDLLDFSNEEIFSSAATANTDSDNHHYHLPSSGNTTGVSHFNSSSIPACHSTDFTDDLCVPNDDVAELEWLSNFVDDSFSDFPVNNLNGTANFRSDTQFPGRSRSKRSRAVSTNTSWTSTLEFESTPVAGKSIPNYDKKKENSSSSTGITRDRSSSSVDSSDMVERRCTHCASEKTPQWRTGPLGPKTLCNACGVRYKSGRLVPEYRPAASPTFVLTQHSNSHRKVMELRRQKEVLRQQKQPEHQLYAHHHHHNYEVC